MEILGISIISDISDTQSDIVMEELKGNEIPDRRSGEKHGKQLSKPEAGFIPGGRSDTLRAFHANSSKPSAHTEPDATAPDSTVVSDLLQAVLDNMVSQITGLVLLQVSNQRLPNLFLMLRVSR